MSSTECVYNPYTHITWHAHFGSQVKPAIFRLQLGTDFQGSQPILVKMLRMVKNQVRAPERNLPHVCWKGLTESQVRTKNLLIVHTKGRVKYETLDACWMLVCLCVCVTVCVLCACMCDSTLLWYKQIYKGHGTARYNGIHRYVMADRLFFDAPINLFSKALTLLCSTSW